MEFVSYRISEGERLLIALLALSLGAMERGLTLSVTWHSAGAAVASFLNAHFTITKLSPSARVAEMFECYTATFLGAADIDRSIPDVSSSCLNS
jgi:hypothetical protein